MALFLSRSREIQSCHEGLLLLHNPKVHQPFDYVHHEFDDSMNWPSCWIIDQQKRLLILVGTTFEGRTNSMHATLRQGHEKYNNRLVKGYDETFPVCTPNGEQVLDMDDFAVRSMGIITCGVFLMTYVFTEAGTKYWIQKRSISKKVYLGIFDITAAVSLRSGEIPLDGVVREAAKEAGTPEQYS